MGYQQLLQQHIADRMNDISSKLCFTHHVFCALNTENYDETSTDRLQILYEFLVDVDERINDLVQTRNSGKSEKPPQKDYTYNGKLSN